jgi:KH domain
MPVVLVCLFSFPHLLLFTFFLASPQGSRSPSPSGRDVLTLRALVSTKDAGVIIGKGGKNVADLREQTGVKAGVSRNLPGIHDRVLSISGSVESVAKVCLSNLLTHYTSA